MKRTIISIVIVLMIAVYLPYHAAALSYERDEDEKDLLLLFIKTTEKIEDYVYANYPMEIVNKPCEYNMRITNPDILNKETQDGTMTASKIDEVRFRSFYSEVFSEEITSLILENPNYPLSSCGIFKYEDSYYMIPGYVWNLPALSVGPDIEHCKPLWSGFDIIDVPYDELTINNDEARMLVTLWHDNGSTPPGNIADSKMGQYDLLFTRTVNGWKVSGGSFTDLLLGIRSSEYSPSTGDRSIILISVSSLSFCFCIFQVKIIRSLRKKKSFVSDLH